jgi:hypothetical protein
VATCSDIADGDAHEIKKYAIKYMLKNWEKCGRESPARAGNQCAAVWDCRLLTAAEGGPLTGLHLPGGKAPLKQSTRLTKNYMTISNLLANTEVGTETGENHEA